MMKTQKNYEEINYFLFLFVCHFSNTGTNWFYTYKQKQFK